jgi:hypothetical protein
MTDYIQCPNCGFSYDMRNHPDYWNDGTPEFTFTCYECPDKNVEFEVEVEYEPIFSVLKTTMREIKY